MIDLDGLVKNDKPQLGELKMTVAQFFRVNGGTTQLKGVTPDIGFPARSDDSALGESAFDNALPWTMIKAIHNAPDAAIGAIVPALLAGHASRTKLDADFRYLQQDMDERQRQLGRNEISLNETERRQERAARLAQLAARQADTHSGSPGSSPGSATTPPMVQGAALDDGMLPGERSFKEELRAEKSMTEVERHRSDRGDAHHERCHPLVASRADLVLSWVDGPCRLPSWNPRSRPPSKRR